MAESILLMCRDLDELNAVRPERSVLFAVHNKTNPLKDFFLARCHGEPFADEPFAGERDPCDGERMSSLDRLDCILTEADRALAVESLVIRDLTRALELLSVTESELWSVLQLDGEAEIVTELSEAEALPSTSATTAGSEGDSSKLSYRDVVALASQEKASETAPSLEQLHSPSKWEPKYVLEKTSSLRLDRKYGMQPSFVDEDEGALPSYMLHLSLQYDVDLGVSDMTDRYYQRKAGVGLARHRDQTMLTPAAQEKRDIRVAEKARSLLS